MTMRRFGIAGLLSLFAGVAFAFPIPDELLNQEPNGTVGDWWPNSDTALEALLEKLDEGGLDFERFVAEAGEHVKASAGGQCQTVGSADGALVRACGFFQDMNAYAAYLRRDRACNEQLATQRVQGVLGVVASPDVDIDKVKGEIASPAGSLQVALPDRLAQGSDMAFPLFETEPDITQTCDGIGNLSLPTMRVPSASVAASDRLILGYAYLITLANFKNNRVYLEATASEMAKANKRWTDFERNAILDQYPWETLFFNDWVVRGSQKFTGTLMNPPTRQIRALHPVPTAILDAGGEDTLFRPRITVEVFGIRHLDANDEYKAKRGLSLVAALKADTNESTGWGFLYTWHRGSIGLIHQEIAEDDVIGLVFGIDLANQIDGKKNKLMKRWDDVRMKIEEPK